jgi:hypothetical protein
MTVRIIASCGLLLAATSAQAGKPFDVHGLIVGDEGARYVKGVPTLDLQQRRGAIELRSLGFYNNRPMFAIAFYNAGPEPVNIGLEDIHVAANGGPLTVFPVEELERQAKHKAWWSQFAVAMLGGLSAGAAASQRDYSHGTITGPYGTYTIHTSYPSLAGALQADRIEANTAFSIAAIQYQLDRTIELINDHVVQRTTVDPGSSYGGLIIMDKLKTGNPPFELHLDVDWNGERYPFAYVMQKPGQPVSEHYNAMLAAKAKPKALNTLFAAPAFPGRGPATASHVPSKRIEGVIFLASGAVKIPAKTVSGYCLKAPDNYLGTGAIDTPVISGALPRCLDDSGRVAVQKDSAFRRYE